MCLDLLVTYHVLLPRSLILDELHFRPFKCVKSRKHVHTFPGDVARVNGQLAVSRAFGDKNLKNHLRSDPDVTNAEIDSQTDLLILASDGIWKVFFFATMFVFLNLISL